MSTETTLERRPRTRELLAVFAGPLIWFVHFLTVYIAVAVWCARFASPGGDLGGARIALLIWTGVTVVAELMVAWRGFKLHRHGFAIDPSINEGSAEERRRFLGFACWLLAGLSLTATVYVALPLLYFSACQG